MRLADMSLPDMSGFAPPPFKPDGALAQVKRIDALKPRLARWPQEN